MSILTSQHNSLIKHWVKLSLDPSYRKETKSCVIEGKKMVQEAIERGGVKQILVRDDMPLLSKALLFLLLHSSATKFLLCKAPMAILLKSKSQHMTL